MQGNLQVCLQVSSQVTKYSGHESIVTHPAAKGVRQKEFGKKVTKKVAEASAKVTINSKGGKDPHPQDFSFTKKTARCTKGQFRPY